MNEQVVTVLFLKTVEKAKQDIPTRTKGIVLFLNPVGDLFLDSGVIFVFEHFRFPPKRIAAFINRRLATAANN